MTFIIIDLFGEPFPVMKLDGSIRIFDSYHKAEDFGNTNLNNHIVVPLINIMGSFDDLINYGNSKVKHSNPTIQELNDQINERNQKRKIR